MAPQRIEHLDDTRRLQLLVEGVVDFALYTISLDGRSPTPCSRLHTSRRSRQGQICRRADRQALPAADLTPRNKNDALPPCRGTAKKLSRQTKQAAPESLLGSQRTLSSHAARARKAVRSQNLHPQLHSVVALCCNMASR